MTTILTLNLTAIKGTSNVNCGSLGDSQSVCTLQFDQFHVCTEMLTVLLCRMQNYTIHNSLYYQ